MFDETQTAILADKLDKGDVRSRAGPNGRKVSYLEGWHVIEIANEVFGFGNWDAETVEMRREHEPVIIPPSEDKPRGGAVVTYSAAVRITVYNKDGTRKIARQRWGGHRQEGATVGEAIENCIKSAETDALKRAFVTFGNVFGLALYDKSGKNIGTPEVNRTPGAHAIDVGFSDVTPESGRESGRALVRHAPQPAPESAPARPSNSQQALATLNDRQPQSRPAGRGHTNGNGGLRY